MAHVLFLRGFNNLGGAYCKKAFKSIHLLARPSSDPNLLVYLTTQVMCPNSALTLQAWRYLAVYATKSGTPELLQQLFRGCADYIEENGFESYLDLVADRIGDMLFGQKRPAEGQFPHFPTHYIESVNRDLQNNKHSRAYTIVSRFAAALGSNINSSSRDYAETMSAQNWNRLIELHAVANETDWKHDDVLRGAMGLLEQTLNSGSGGHYFEITALVAVAAYSRARWDGLVAHSHPRHVLARLYLEKAIDAAVRYDRCMSPAHLENLAELEKWYQEAGCVQQASLARLKRQSWVQKHSRLMCIDL